MLRCLTDCNQGEEVIVRSVNIGHRQRIRLANLGLFPGVKIKKIKSAPFSGPVEIIVRGTSLVIGRGIASRIMVECNHSCAPPPSRYRKHFFT